MFESARSRVVVLVFALACTMAAPAPRVTAAVPDPDTSGYLDVEGGRIYYETFGRGFPIVLIHDGLVHSVVWDAQASDLAKDYQVIRYDRRGYGRSDAPTEPYSNIEDLHALIEHLGIDRAVVIGSSAGGGLAIDYTLDHPGRVEALVLAGAVVNGLGYSFHFMRRGYANYSLVDSIAVENWITDEYSIAPGNDDARARVAEILRANPHNVNYAKFRLVQGPERPALGRLSEVAVPTLIVVAEDDVPDVHAHAGAIEAGIPASKRILLDDAGHLSYLEQPAAFNAAVREFFSQITLPRGETEVTRRTTAPWSTFRRGFLDVDGGVLYYETMGEGEPLVLAHGGSLDHRMWDDQFERFARDFLVIRYDSRGNGLSKTPFGTRRDYDDLRALLDHLGIHRANLVGLSLGGRIVIDFAIQYPECVAKLIAVGPGLSGYDFVADEEKAFFEQITEAYIAADFERAAQCMLEAWTAGPHRRPEDLDPVVRERMLAWLREGVKPGTDGGSAIPLDPPATERLAEIKAPTLVVIGALDMPGILEIADMIEKQVHGAQKAVIEDAAHMVNVEKPDEFNKVVLEFLHSGE